MVVESARRHCPSNDQTEREMALRQIPAPWMYQWFGSSFQPDVSKLLFWSIFAFRGNSRLPGVVFKIESKIGSFEIKSSFSEISGSKFSIWRIFRRNLLDPLSLMTQIWQSRTLIIGSKFNSGDYVSFQILWIKSKNSHDFHR